MTDNKVIVFDMDGTIADLYGVENWLIMLQDENPLPYLIAKPLYDMEKLTAILNRLKALGYIIAVTSWLAKDSSKEYDKKVRGTKKFWLETYNFPYDEIHIVKYGTTKAKCTRHLGGRQILIDDNAQVREGWTLGETVDANGNILEFLNSLL